MADSDSMGCVVTQTHGWAFDFLLRIQNRGQVFGKLDQMFEKFSRAFERHGCVF